MQESVPLSMPLAVRSRPPLWLRLLPLWLVLLLAVGTVWWWVDSGRVESARAELDGMVLSVAPSYSARVLEVSVRPGQEVRQGALLARLDAADYNRRLGQAAREADDLRRMAGPPGREETAARLRDAEAAEKDMVRRLAQARHEEDMRQRQRQESVAAHVRAQLHLRGLDSQGGARVVGQNVYAAARRSEAETRDAMDRATAAFEEVSRIRAALDQELGRVRSELLRYKELTSRGCYRQPAGRDAPMPVPVAEATLRAPQDALVLRVLATPGQTAARDEPLVLLLPQGEAASGGLWLRAGFLPEDARRLKPGQPCDVRLEADGRILAGTVADLLPQEVAPAGDAAAPAAEPAFVKNNTALTYVRIRLDVADSSGLVPGMAARCSVRTRSLW